MIHSLQYLSLNEALQFMPNTLTVAISILSPGRAAAALNPGITDTLRLYFHDGVPIDNNPPDTTLFSAEHARMVIDFLHLHNSTPEARHLLIHCEGGISRSAAIGVFFASECHLPLTGQFAFLNPWVLATLMKAAYPHYAFD